MASYKYKGQAITGTSTTAKVFKKSKVSKAKVGDTYFNTETGHVYRCDVKGSPSEAKWKYVRTDIAKKPSLAVTGLGAPKRENGRHMTANWNVPANLTNAKKGDRATDLVITWWLGLRDSKDPKEVIETTNEARTTSSINLSDITIGSTRYTRNSFYPVTKKKLDYVTVQVRAKNSKGLGPKAKETRKFEAPRTPSISAFSFNTENGTVSATITTNAGTDYKERYDTRYIVAVKNTRTGQTFNHANTSSTSTSINVSYDATDYQQLGYNDYIRITVTAWARGYAGDSAKVSKTYYVAYPKEPSITKLDVSSRTPTGKCTALVKTNTTTEHPVDSVRLEYLANTEYARASQIPGTADWTSTDVVDDKDCTALTISVNDLIPEAGNYTWLRVKSYHASEVVLRRYSTPVRVTALETPAPTAADEEVVIISLAPGGSGESLVAVLAWNADGQDDATGTELSWSEYEDTWKSTETPKAFEFDWSDGPLTHEGVTYHDSATIVIKGLDEGTNYFVKARRYLDADSRTYSPYSNTASEVTSSTPDAVVASGERYVPRGKSYPVSWTLSGNGVQRAWQIVTSGGAIIAEGTDRIGATQISADRLRSFAVNGTVAFTVQVSTGSGFIVSEAQTVTIVDPPELSITHGATLTVQPLSFTATSSSLCDLIVIVTSQGVSGQFPQGLLRQTAGDTIHSNVYTPEWTTSGDDFTTTVALPLGLDFWNLGTYELSVEAIDRVTGLSSGAKVSTFTVGWTDTAVYPYDFVELTPIDEITADGLHRQAVQIDLTPPTGSAETDVYDIYRLTGDGPYLIGEGFPLTYTAVDEYAPFGDMTQFYRVALRTTDGDVSFADIDYTLTGDSMRFDWAGGTLELPYNIEISDNYKKDVDIRQHLDGDTDGYWNSAIERTASLNSDMIRLTQGQDIIDVRQLARYSGPVFVRTPDGSAYEADVQVTDLSVKGALTAIAIDATEVGLTDEFILPAPFVLEEGE